MVQLRQLLFDQHLDGTLKVSPIRLVAATMSSWRATLCSAFANRNVICSVMLHILCHCNCSFVFGTFRISKTDGTISVVQPASATMFVFVPMRRVKTSPRTERASMVLRISVIYGSIPSCKCRWVTPTLFLTCLFEHLFRCVVHSLSFRRSVFGSTTAVFLETHSKGLM